MFIPYVLFHIKYEIRPWDPMNSLYFFSAVLEDNEGSVDGNHCGIPRIAEFESKFMHHLLLLLH